ncbi:MAG: hypothetical protein CMH65_04040 [Nevskiales bacterium]|nr:hypothetical protein [Nevskiales bacterium]
MHHGVTTEVIDAQVLKKPGAESIPCHQPMGSWTPQNETPTMQMLLIDDCPFSQALIGGMLSTVYPDLDLSYADDAVDFTASDGIGRYDCVLLDYRLPSRNGLELLAQAREARVETPPVIMLSGQNDVRVAVEAIKLGSCDFLPKQDLSAAQLGQAVASAMKQRRRPMLDRRRAESEPTPAITPPLQERSKAFSAALRQQIELCRERDASCAIFVLDTRFSPAFGVPLSDNESRALLRQSEQRLSAALRAGDSIHRIGPGRVAALLAGCTSEQVIAAIRARVQRRLMGTYPLTPTRYANARTEIGVAVYPADGASDSDLIQHALTALSQQRFVCIESATPPPARVHSH